MEFIQSFLEHFINHVVQGTVDFPNCLMCEWRVDLITKERKIFLLIIFPLDVVYISSFSHPPFRVAAANEQF